jgi:DNA-directed RNA polymerase specialized sigma24 family protein
MEGLMVKKNAERDEVSVDDRVLAELRTTDRLLAMLATRGMEQRDAIALLHSMSFPPRAIAAALSITPNAVSIAIHRMKKVETSEPRAKASAVTGDVVN